MQLIIGRQPCQGVSGNHPVDIMQLIVFDPHDRFGGETFRCADVSGCSVLAQDEDSSAVGTEQDISVFTGFNTQCFCIGDAVFLVVSGNDLSVFDHIDAACHCNDIRAVIPFNHAAGIVGIKTVLVGIDCHFAMVITDRAKQTPAAEPEPVFAVFHDGADAHIVENIEQVHRQIRIQCAIGECGL